MFGDPESPMPETKAIPHERRLLELGIAAGRATSERDFDQLTEAFHRLYNGEPPAGYQGPVTGSPVPKESTGGPRTLAAALNLHQD